MKWESGRRSDNVEDRRGMSAGAIGGGSLVLGVLALVVYMLGGDPRALLEVAQSHQESAPAARGRPGSEATDEGAQFVSVVLADTEDTWHQVFRETFQREYQEPKLVLFTGSVQSACGVAGTAVGPFYCPRDQQVYIDLAFYRDLKERFSAPGDFAQAYVIAHEVGHHVQNLLGLSDRVSERQARTGGAQANALSVRVELQADCYAGVWGHHAQRVRQILEPGDLEEALNAASAIGDDRLQSETQGRVVPESFTHGTSAQRVSWFKRGFDSGRPGDCNTFAR
jgi:predicted metalloprotease